MSISHIEGVYTVSLNLQSAIWPSHSPLQVVHLLGLHLVKTVEVVTDHALLLQNSILLLLP